METLLDVCNLPPRERHPKIFATWEALPVGGILKLVNDHDPKPLYYHFKAERGDAFAWDYLESGPEVWKVRIAKSA